MNIRECYEQFNGDYEGVVKRLGKEERVILCTKMFKEGNDYQMIEDALNSDNLEDAFRNVHNMKGVASNLGFTPLFEVADILCEALRPGNPYVEKERIIKMLEDVKKANDNIMTSLSMLDE